MNTTVMERIWIDRVFQPLHRDSEVVAVSLVSFSPKVHYNEVCVAFSPFC